MPDAEIELALKDQFGAFLNIFHGAKFYLQTLVRRALILQKKRA